MTSWNRIQSGFDADDETVNFGMRIVAENNGSLYETRTIATIESFEKVNHEPSVLASLQYSKLCVAVDKSITVFEDETCDEVLCNISFSSTIACYCISKNGFFLFVMLTTGVLYCLHLSDGKIIFTKSIPDNQDNVMEIFLKEQDEETFIILILETGAIHKFFNICLKTLEMAFINDDKNAIMEHIADIQCSELFEGFTSLKFLNVTVNASSEELLIAMIGTNSIFTWPDKQYNNLSTLPFDYKKIKFLNNSSILCLRTDNILNVICSNTLLGLKIYEGSVFDFTIIRHDDYCDILFLTESKHNSSMYVLCLISYPDFEQKLVIDVSVSIHLFETLHAPSNIFYIEGIITENKIIDAFRVKAISESIPEMRLARLLRKRQFDAAEIFAQRLGLSMESIYYSKAALFIEQLSPWTKSASNSVSVDALIDVLDKIQDVQYITECCSKALISDHIQMKRIYLYARQRIMQNVGKKNTNDRLYTNLSIMNDALHKLETFQMIQNIETDIILDDNAAIKEWIRFSQINLLEEFMNHLRMSQLTSATLIWTRHFSDIMKHVSIQNVQNIFIILPEDVAPSCLWPWLIHFVPTLSFLLPDAMDEIVFWGLRKLKYLEISHRTSWPQIGTDFAKKFVRLLKFGDNQQSIYFHQEYKCQNSALKQFMHLLQALSDIQQLKDDYRLRISLDTYIDSPVETIYMLLDKIQLDEITNFVNTFLKRYMLNNNLQNDTIFCAYIQRIIKGSNSWWFVEEVPWEKRIAIMIDFIYDIENQLEQILAVLRKAPVPWSSTITTLAQIGSNFDHDLVFKIKIERDYVPIKLILKKYGCTTIDVNNRLISLIIKENRDSMINDLDVLTINNGQLKQDVFCRCINVRLNEGDTQKAIDIIQHLEKDVTDALYCYEGIVNFIIAAISFRNVTTSLTYHIEILGCLEFKIHNLLTQSNVCSFRCNNIINTIKDLKSLYALRRDYKIDISLKDYRTQKSLTLRNYITKLLQSMKENNLSIIHKKIVKVAELLGLERSHAILFFAEQTKNMDVLQQFMYDGDQNLNIISDRCKDMNKICLSTLQHVSLTNTNVIETIKNLSVLTLNTCKDSDLQSTLILYSCVNACPNLFIQQCSDIKPKNVPQSWKLYTIYKDQTISLDQLSFLFKDIISLYLYHSDQINSDNITCNEEISKLLNNFLECVKKMQLQHNDYSLLQIFKMFYFMCHSTFVKDEAILTEMDSILSQLLTNLLKKLCTGRSFDLHLGLSCLFMLTKQEACNWLSTACTSLQTDYNRHSIISTLGYEYSRFERNRSLMQMFEGYKLLHIWAQRLSYYSIAYKEIFINSSSSKREILQQIVNSNKENVIPLLKDYCCGFGFNFNDCLLLYLQTLLKSWKPTITILNTNVNKELIISDDEINELREKCNTIIERLEDKSMLKKNISTLWEQITFYHYEIFLILLDLVGEKDTEKRDYLCFLQNYTRNGPPTSMELDEWIYLNPGHSSLPPIAQWRLPFLFNVDIWKIITPELNLKTYKKWLDIASVLKLETHLICTLAIKGEVTRVWENNSVKHKDVAWSLYPKNTMLLKNIKECIQHITDSDGSYYATAALYYVMNHTPSGADRVAVAKECYEYAQLAARNSSKFEEGMLEKIRSKYLRFTAEHILRTHGLEKENYITLIENAHKLVYELYNDESIPLRYRIATNYRPDINLAVDELSELFSLNIIKLRLDLLHEWLQSNVKCMELYQSFTETLTTPKGIDQCTDHEDNLLRACYMLEHDNTDLFPQFLINIGFGHLSGEAEYNYNVRYRALRVLQTIVDTATLEELTKRDICTFRRYIKSLQYVSKLESLGLYYSINAFETCSKRELIQILWKNQRHLPYAVSVIAQICIEFEICDILLWDGILSQLTKLRMIKELKKILLQMRNESVIVNCNGYKIGWQLIVSEPFREMDMNLNEEQIDNCTEAICLLYSCPVVHELDFTVIIKYCFQCKQVYLAAALLPFLNESEIKSVLEVINQTCQIAEIIENLNHLSSKGVLTVAHSIAIVQKSMS